MKTVMAQYHLQGWPLDEKKCPQNAPQDFISTHPLHGQGGSTYTLSLQEQCPTGFSLIQYLKGKEKIIALEVEGVLCDLSRPLPVEAVVRPITLEMPQGLSILRHTAAHVLAQAVKELFPETQITIGPVIEDGFFYDFHRETPFRQEDLQVLQDRMDQIVDRNAFITFEEKTKSDAKAFFLSQGENFKGRIIDDLPDAMVTLYHQENFSDLCRGPHLPSTQFLKGTFKLMRISGAYWRGDTRNTQLQRIYGVAFATPDDLKAYLIQREEAEKRDHRRLAKIMDLFHFQEEAPGSVFWHPQGCSLYQILQQYMRSVLRHDYLEVNTPQLVSSTLWQASGHWDKFKENMFCLDHKEHHYGLKPMNCPCHVQIFNQGVKSYKELPLRLSEFGSCVRYEPSGALSGLMRLRAFVQDDAHIFCLPQQLVQETKKFCDLLFSVYHTLGFHDVTVRFSSRPDKRLGSDGLWDKAESALQDGAHQAGLSMVHCPGEGAFYGPKLEFVLKDSLGRPWQCGTLQADFVLPERLGAFYVDETGHKQHPVMLHRAILGSMERFIGILLEHYGGHLPFWLAPTQGVVLTISEKTASYGQEVYNRLIQNHWRVIYDKRCEKLGYKVREHTTKKVPVLMVVGPQEEAEGLVSVRHGGHSVTMTLDALMSVFQRALDTHGIQLDFP